MRRSGGQPPPRIENPWERRWLAAAAASRNAAKRSVVRPTVDA